MFLGILWDKGIFLFILRGYGIFLGLIKGIWGIFGINLIERGIGYLLLLLYSFDK